MPSSTVAFFALVYGEMDHWMLLDSTPGNLLQFLKHHGFWSRLANWNPHPGRLHVSILREQKVTWSCFVVLSFSIVSIMVSSTFLMMQRDAMGLITGMICEATMASWSRKPFRSSERVCFHISHPFTGKVIAVFLFHIVISFFCLYGRGYQIPVPLLSDHSGLQAMRWPISPCCHPGTSCMHFGMSSMRLCAHIRIHSLPANQTQ